MGKLGEKISTHCGVCLKGRPRQAYRSCANCTGSSPLILHPKRTSRAYSTRPPAVAAVQASYGVTLLPIAALRPWRRRTATISSVANAKPSRFSPRLPARPTSFRCSSAIRAWANPRWRRRACSRRLSVRPGPKTHGAPNAWPAAFQDSRQWCFLSFKPGTDPLKALVEAFLDTWQFAATDSERVKQQNGWIELLRDGKADAV